jgi:S1-C subfamily serine protease
VRLAIAALLLAGWACAPLATPEVAPRFDAEIDRQVERAVEGRLGLRGLTPLRRESGAMLAGESRSFEIELQRGDQFLAVGACDEGCSDLDLEITGPRDEPWDADARPDAFPIAGGIAMRSGRHTLHARMASCAERCRFSLALLAAPLGAGAAERDRLGEASRLHAALVARVRSDFAAKGLEIARLDGFEQPSLGGGRQETFSVRVARAGWVLVAADCDFGCEDLDLIVEDAAGAPLAQDLEPDPVPRLWVELPVPGTYRVTVRMEHCVVEPCAYAASVLTEAPEPPAFGSGERQGSCFAVHPEGLVATAAHVVAGTRSLRVHLPDGAALAAEIHALDEQSDLAVLRIPRPTPDHLPLAPAASAALGQRVFTLGFPALDLLGADPKFTDGVIAGLVGPPFQPRAYQITVPIQPGSSGGALVTEQGYAIGVVTGVANPDSFAAATGYAPQSVNYAVRSDFLARLLPALEPPPPPVDRAQAIERAQAAACWVEAIGVSSAFRS